jgi:hypothetical protein
MLYACQSGDAMQMDQYISTSECIVVYVYINFDAHTHTYIYIHIYKYIYVDIL